MKLKLIKLFAVGFSILLVACNTNNNTGLEQKLDAISDDQKVMLKKMASLEKTGVVLSIKLYPSLESA